MYGPFAGYANEATAFEVVIGGDFMFYLWGRTGHEILHEAGLYAFVRTNYDSQTKAHYGSVRTL